MRRAVAALALALLVVAVNGSSVASQEAAASISDVGWWTSNPTATAPEKGIAVSAGPSGPITVAAVRVLLLADSIDTAALVLKEDGGVQASGAQLQVCTTPNAWAGGPKQTMDKAPKPECDRAKAALARGADGTWRADVRTLLVPPSEDQTEVSLMIVPAGSGAVPLGFEVRFQPPVLEATGTSEESSEEAFSSDSFSSSDSSSDFSSSPGGSSTSESFSTPSDSFTSTQFPDSSPLPSLSSAQTSGTFESAPTASDTTAADVAAPPAAESSSVAAPPIQRAAPASQGPRGSRVGQALFFVVLSTVVGVGVGFGHSRLRPAGGGLVT